MADCPGGWKEDLGHTCSPGVLHRAQVNGEIGSEIFQRSHLFSLKDSTCAFLFCFFDMIDCLFFFTKWELVKKFSLTWQDKGRKRVRASRKVWRSQEGTNQGCF